jgi:hypothetical protein
LKLKPPTMLRSRKLQSLVALGVTFAGLSGFAVSQAVPASADPTETYVVVGSDTIQDVYNAFSLAFGSNRLGSYNATNPVTGAIAEEITPVDGTGGVNCSFDRPNGSGAGIAALRYNLGDHTVSGLQGTHDPQTGCVDIARSSSAPPTGGYAGTDAIQFIPFAIDGVTGSTGPFAGDPTIGTTFTADEGNGSTTTATIQQSSLSQTDLNDFTTTNLQQLYGTPGFTTVAATGVTYAAWSPANGTGNNGFVAGAPSTAQRIDLYIPQANSGTLKFWLGSTLLNVTQQVWDNQTIVNAPGAPALVTANTPVEEHDGTADAVDPFAYFPFSIAQWISQRNGHNDRRHGATLANANMVDPYAGTGVPATGTLNTALGAYNRDVWSVAAQARVLAGGDLEGLLTSSINGVSVGTAQLCTETPLIVSYGFARLSTCGAVVTPNDAQQI